MSIEEEGAEGVHDAGAVESECEINDHEVEEAPPYGWSKDGMVADITEMRDAESKGGEPLAMLSGLTLPIVELGLG